MQRLMDTTRPEDRQAPLGGSERYRVARIARSPHDPTTFSTRAHWCPDPPARAKCRGCGALVDIEEVVAARHVQRCTGFIGNTAALAWAADILARL